MELIGFIAGLIGLIALICFFLMAQDIREIRRVALSKPKGSNPAEDRYNKHMFWNETREAREALKDSFWFEFRALNNPSHKKDVKLMLYNNLVEKYQSAFDVHGMSIPYWDGKSDY
jgi:hypothetical protein